jgi:4-hydroxybenzoate polyprenyltransferase
MSTELLLGHHSFIINFFVFFATLFTYNFQRLVRMDVRGELSFRQQWLQENSGWLWGVTCISGIVTALLALRLSTNSLWLLLPLGVVAMMYPLPVFFWNRKWWRLREIPGIKIFLIASVWSLVTVGLLVTEHNVRLNTDVWMLFLQRLCFIFAIIIPFDIRDLKYDSLKLKTIPVMLGETKARYIGLGAVALYELLVVAQFLFGNIITLRALIALLCVSGITALLLLKSTSERSEYYFSFWVEGTSVLMYILLAIALYFF